MTATSIDVDTISRITDTDEAERLGNAVYRALLDDLRMLKPVDWRAATVCAPWTISDIVRHLLGAAKANASIREFLRQQIHGARHKSEFDGNALDATNSLQVADHVRLDPAELLAELEGIYGKSVRTRMSRSRLLRRLDVPVGAGGSSAAGMPTRLNLGELLRVVYTRDVWLHRVDIARALDREPPMEAAVDGRLVADVVREWADRHGQPFDLHLTGTAGGHYRRGVGGQTITLDAIDFCWILSGRGEPADASSTALLSHRVWF